MGRKETILAWGLVLVFLSLAVWVIAEEKEDRGVKEVGFDSVALAQNDSERKRMRISPYVEVIDVDGVKQRYALSYRVLAHMGEKIGSGVMGMITDVNGTPLLQGGQIDISQSPDGNSLITVGGQSYLITHMEEAPGVLYQTKLASQSGKVVAQETEAMNLSAIGGTIINCASSKTSYGSHLGGEEDYSLNSIYADSASPYYVACALDGRGSRVSGEFDYFCEYVDRMKAYLGDETIDKADGYNGTYFSPYHYGYIVEVQPQRDGSVKSAKHYVTGKYTPELAVMMPDLKTLYISDDGTAKGLWKFVSDEKITEFKQVWQGTLYAAKLTQRSAKNGGQFDIAWVRLGHGNDRQIKEMIQSKMKLTDIFEVSVPDAQGRCIKGVKVYEDGMEECLLLKSGQERAAAFLESRKYAAYLGATIEFRKEEGLTYDKERNRLYIAMSAIEKSMEDNYQGREPDNAIRLQKNICGGIYTMRLDSLYSGKTLEPLLMGVPLNVGDQYAEHWRCHPEHIANPDNIRYIGHDLLIISEDTTSHVNNMSWAYNVKSQRLTRIASLPMGAEVTGVEAGVVGSKGVLMMNIQHPFVDTPQNAEGKLVYPSLIESASDQEMRAAIGYFDGLPAGMFQ